MRDSVLTRKSVFTILCSSVVGGNLILTLTIHECVVVLGYRIDRCTEDDLSSKLGQQNHVQD